MRRRRGQGGALYTRYWSGHPPTVGDAVHFERSAQCFFRAPVSPNPRLGIQDRFFCRFCAKNLCALLQRGGCCFSLTVTTVGPVNASDFDFAHSDQAAKSRQEKATTLARYVWDHGIEGAELLALDDATRRKLARAADLHPPSTMETWTIVAELLDRKSEWASANPGHPGAKPEHADEKIMWVKPPITPW